ncbi:MAG: heparinase II/III family protein [Bacteroidia bacterium]|nr:heparinase II/III family protein [Bacteroidia bacterium]
MKKVMLSLLFLGIYLQMNAQKFPSHRVPTNDELPQFLKKESIRELKKQGEINSSNLAAYFRKKFTERYFYDFRNNESRFGDYDSLYQLASYHRERAMDHMGKYADSTPWKLPFNYLNGKAVNAYALRHLARQHKMLDVSFHFFYEQKDPAYIRYFEGQQKSLNQALLNGQYEKIEDGNGVYEAFRSGYRILNWLQIHALFLGQEEYSDQDQLQTLSTLLQHAAHLYERNDRFHPGNHQTRGMSALAMIAILLRDFEDAELWYKRAMKRLGEHLEREINPDGFQFERSVHYHMSDINNYFYVYRLAQINEIKVDPAWENKLQMLFTTLCKIAYPDKSAPVLQDDTDEPWAESNDIEGAMTLGYLLFQKAEYGYFAGDKVDAKMYWFLNKDLLDLLKNKKQVPPKYASLYFPDTHYYIMREGWNMGDKMMIISAGLDSIKPDHQHGDMLGIQAMANGKVILPNYQVRYSLKDYEVFKNSLVKNVALVDDELLGRKWTSNKGGSGFGKFKDLPKPRTIAWKSNSSFDLFVGSHDGFQRIGVDYERQVIFVKNSFWIVKDNFNSDQPHTYKQVFQGHYTPQKRPELIRSVFADGSGCDILQLNPIDSSRIEGTQGKHRAILSRTGEKNFSFITVIFPFKGYQNRINEELDSPVLNAWQLNNTDWKSKESQAISFSKSSESYFFNMSSIVKEGLEIGFSSTVDLHLDHMENIIMLTLLSSEPTEVLIKHKGKPMRKSINAGETLLFQLE